METLPIGTLLVTGGSSMFICGYGVEDTKDVYRAVNYGRVISLTQVHIHRGIQQGYISIPQGRFEIWETYCECGAHKCGTRHSDWCPAYKGYNK